MNKVIPKVNVIEKKNKKKNFFERIKMKEGRCPNMLMSKLLELIMFNKKNIKND